MAAPGLSGVRGFGTYATAGGTAQSAQVTLTTTVGRGLRAVVVSQEHGTHTVSDNRGNTWVKVGSDIAVTQDIYSVTLSEWFCASNLTGGAGHIITGTGPTGCAPSIQVEEFDTAVATDATSNTTETGASPYDASLTTVAAEARVMAAIMPWVSTGWAVTASGYTTRGSYGDPASVWPIGTLDKALSSAATENSSFAVSGNVGGTNIPIRLTSYKAASGGTSAATATAAAGSATVSSAAASRAASAGTSAAGAATVSALASATVRASATAAAGSATVSATGSAGAASSASAVPATGQATVSGQALSAARAAPVAAAGVATASATTPSQEGGRAGFEMGARMVRRKPLLEQILEARATKKVKPAHERAAKRAKAIEVEAAELALNDGSKGQLDQLLSKWKAERPVVPEAVQMPLNEVFLAQVAFRLRQMADEHALRAEMHRRQDDEDALAILLMA